MNAYRIIIEDGKVTIDPKDHFNTFIQIKYGGKRVNTRKKNAEIICKFLGEDKIGDVTEEKVVQYLKDRASSGIGEDTYIQERTTILNFVSYLEAYNVIPKLDHDQFCGLPTAPAKVSNKINDIRKEYLSLLFQVCVEHEPKLALFLLLSISGGLRPSECLTLTKGSISPIGPFGKDGFIVDVEDHKFRANQREYVKRTRKQRTLPFGQVGADIYETHIKKHTVPDNPALFVDNYGNAMTYQALNKRFGILKKHFVKALIESDDPAAIAYGHFLQTRRWGPHIGRGIYSNEIVRNTNNISEIAAARGDRSPLSVLPYIQQHAVERLSDLLKEV